MPEIKQYAQRTTPVLQFQQPQPHFRPMESGVSALAEGLQAATDVYEKRMEEQGRAWATSALSDARLHWTAELKRRQEEADPNATDFTQTFINDFDEYAKQTITNAPTPQAKKFLHERLSDVRVSFGEQATNFEATARIDYRNDQFNKAIDNGQKLMALDPGQFKVILAEQLAIVDSSAMPPKQKSAMREKVVNGIASASVMSRIQKDPTGFLAQIGVYSGQNAKGGNVTGPTGDEAFDILPFEMRTKLVADALALKNNLESAADKTVERQNKQMRNETMKEAFSLAYPEDGAPSKLTRSWIEKHRPILDDKEYESLIKMSRGDVDGGQKSNPEVFRTVQTLLYDDPERGRAYALREHKNGNLSNADLRDAMGRSESLDRQQGPKSEYERSRARITDSLKPGPLVKDPVGQRRAAEAIYEFDKWVNTAKPDEAAIERKGAEIIQRYQLWDSKRMLPPPIDPTKPAANPHEVALRNIGTRWDKVKADYQAGRITKEEKNAQSVRLRDEMRALGENAPPEMNNGR